MKINTVPFRGNPTRVRGYEYEYNFLLDIFLLVLVQYSRSTREYFFYTRRRCTRTRTRNLNTGTVHHLLEKKMYSHTVLLNRRSLTGNYPFSECLKSLNRFKFFFPHMPYNNIACSSFKDRLAFVHK